MAGTDLPFPDRSQSGSAAETEDHAAESASPPPASRWQKVREKVRLRSHPKCVTEEDRSDGDLSPTFAARAAAAWGFDPRVLLAGIEDPEGKHARVEKIKSRRRRSKLSSPVDALGSAAIGDSSDASPSSPSTRGAANIVPSPTTSSHDAHCPPADPPVVVRDANIIPLNEAEEDLLEHCFLGKTGHEIRKYRESQYNCVNCQFDLWDVPTEMDEKAIIKQGCHPRGGFRRLRHNVSLVACIGLCQGLVMILSTFFPVGGTSARHHDGHVLRSRFFEWLQHGLIIPVFMFSYVASVAGFEIFILCSWSRTKAVIRFVGIWVVLPASVVGTVVLLATQFSEYWSTIYILLPFASQIFFADYVTVCSIRMHVGLQDWTSWKAYRLCWQRYSADLKIVFHSLQLGLFGYFLAVFYLAVDSAYLRFSRFNAILLLRPAMAAVVRKIGFTCMQAADNPWILRARVPGAVLYGSIVKTHLVFGYLNIYVIGGSESWGMVLSFAVTRVAIFAYSCWSYKYDPDSPNYWWGNYWLDLPTKIFDALRVRAYYVDSDSSSEEDEEDVVREDDVGRDSTSANGAAHAKPKSSFPGAHYHVPKRSPSEKSVPLPDRKTWIKPLNMRLHQIRGFEFLYQCRVQSVLYFSVLCVMYPFGLFLPRQARAEWQLYSLLFPKGHESAQFYAALLILDLVLDMICRRVVKYWSGKDFSLHFYAVTK